jgi:phosphoglycerate kinase
MAIIGGAKISDKIEILEVFVKTADIVVVGGAMANTFLLAQGVDIGESMADPDDVDLARDIIGLAKKEAKKRSFVFYLPQDAVVADEINKHEPTRIVDWDAHVIAAIENYPKRPPTASGHVRSNEKILDIGPFSGAFIAGAMQMVNTVIWNGTMGVAEAPGVQGPIGPFAHGTELILESMAGEFGHQPYSIIGGGDTAAYVAQRDLTNVFNHVSTGGGAGLELMAGKKLPGVEALETKK